MPELLPNTAAAYFHGAVGNSAVSDKHCDRKRWSDVRKDHRRDCGLLWDRWK
jgi:hypothetical protein